MNYNNINNENFNEYLEAFNASLFNINFFLFENENEDNNEVNFEIDYEDTDPEIIEIYELKKNGLSFKEDLKIVFNLFDIRFKKLFKYSHDNNFYFPNCSSKVYENTFEDRFKDFENKLIDIEKIEFIKNEIEKIYNSVIFRFNLFSNENQTILKNAKIKKIEFLQSISNGFNFDIIKKDELDLLNFNTFKVLVKNETPITTKPKTNKSLLFNGKELNLSERFKIANKVLDIDKKIRTLNVSDLEKYQLLAYILGCDKDNARNLMNGTYKAKDGDLLNYFNDLGLNK